MNEETTNAIFRILGLIINEPALHEHFALPVANFIKAKISAAEGAAKSFFTHVISHL